MGTRFVITDHALDRFVERHGEIDHLYQDQARQVLLAELEHGVPFGGQVGNGALYLLPCGLVAASVVERGQQFVKTVLSREQAIANMESQGAIVRLGFESHSARRFPAQDALTSVDKAELRVLAERHFRDRVGKKQRNAILRDRGFDPAGEAGEIYRDAYQAEAQTYMASQGDEDRQLGKTG